MTTVGRPQEGEVAPYYFTYINLVEGDDPLPALSQFEKTTTFLRQISEEKSLHRYATGKWSIREVLSHVTDTERAFTFRALWFARGFDAPLPGYDQNVGVIGAEADGVAWASHLEEFARVRLATISLFEHLPDQAWMRTGIASNNPFTVRSVAYIIAGHEPHHVKIIRERYL
jgi:hypothetical protein